MPGRPKPQILLQTPDPLDADINIQIARAQGYYIILYDGEPINIISVNTSQRLWTNTKHYIKTGYAHKGHAFARCRKLNSLFKTDKFTVKELK